MYETEADFDASDQIFEMAERVIRKQFASGFSSLSEQDQYFYCVYKVELGVKNGGLFQLMVNTPPHVLASIPTALRKVGADRSARIVERSLSIALGAGLPADRDHDLALDAVEEEQLDLLSPLDKEFYETREQLCTLLLAYLRCEASSESSAV